MTLWWECASKNLVVYTIIETAKGLVHDSDQLLVDRFIEGDPGAFERLYAVYYDRVFAIAKGILLDSDDAADATQEIFTQVYRSLSRFDRRAKFSTWLFRVAVNRAIQFGRRTKYRQRQAPLHDAFEHPETTHAAEIDPAVEEALAELNPNDRALLALFYWEELSLAEIAASLGCSENAAKTRLYRARERFKEIYKGDGLA